MKMIQEKQLEKYLKSNCFGEDNAIFSKELEKIFHTNGNAIREKVNSLRQQGIPICSSSNGYYYASSKIDVMKTISNLSSRIVGITKAISGLNSYLKK